MTLGVAFARTASRVSAANALGFVAGYCIVNDVTVPHTSLLRPPMQQHPRRRSPHRLKPKHRRPLSRRLPPKQRHRLLPSRPPPKLRHHPLPRRPQPRHRLRL